MEKELLEFIKKNNLTIFGANNIISNEEEVDIFKTRDAKSIHKKVLTKISSEFIFNVTKNLWSFFGLTKNKEEIKKRQEFFKNIESNLNNELLKELKKPKQWWKPKYDILVVTENEKTFVELKNLDCPVKFITSQEDVQNLEKYDLIQVIDCEELGILMENLPQSIFIDSIEDIYLERYLEILSSWEHNINVLNKNPVNKEIKEITEELSNLLKLLNDRSSNKITRERIENALEKINNEISEKIKELTISGTSLFTMLSKSKIPSEIESIITKAITNSQIMSHVFTLSLPVTIDEEELESIIKRQNADEFTDLSKEIQKYSEKLKKIPENIFYLENNIILFDFIAGISKFIESKKDFPKISDKLLIDSSENIFLENAQPISFHLNQENKCSILTGANSGGKTTLIEHIIQLITLFQLGLPITGRIEMPVFTEIYYFAKTKGSPNKGAFETLLTQMSKINPGENTLILADEIEAVTEPGIAGKIVSATAEYFINKQCFLIIATHLGHDIQKFLPFKTRIDGIEAKGLDENFDLIVDHNPVLGRLAHSTPELIVEKMASSQKTSNDYLVFINNFLKNKE